MNFGFELIHITNNRHDSIQIYSYKKEGQNKSAFEIFSGKEVVKNHPDYKRLFSKIKNMVEHDLFHENYFKDQNSETNVSYLKFRQTNKNNPNKLRLYCCRISSHILILGDGGIKNTQKRQDSPDCENAFQELKTVDSKTYNRIRVSRKPYKRNNHFNFELLFNEEDDE